MYFSCPPDSASLLLLLLLFQFFNLLLELAIFFFLSGRFPRLCQSYLVLSFSRNSDLHGYPALLEAGASKVSGLSLICPRAVGAFPIHIGLAIVDVVLGQGPSL